MGMAVDAPSVHAAAWLCPIVGLALFLPLGLLESSCGRLAGNLSPWQYLRKRCPAGVMHAAELLLALLLLLDCASNMRVLAATAGMLTLGRTPVVLLLLPLGILSAVMVLLGGDAAGNTARLWNRILPLLFFVILIFHLPSYNAAWLTPVLGSGLDSILEGGVYCGGSIALLSLSCLLAVPDRKQKPLLPIISIGVFAASLQLAALQMLSPSFTGTELSRSGRISLILSNGRTSSPLQMLMMLLWYGGILHVISAEAVSSAGFLEHALPSVPRWCFAAFEGIAAVAIAGSSIAEAGAYAQLVKRILPAIALLGLILMAMTTLGRRKTACAKQP